MLKDFRIIDKLINKNAHNSEKVINESIYKQFINYNADLGDIYFKDYYFKSMIEVENELSHGKICNMILPLKEVKTELGDLIISVDHILLDPDINEPKIINGTSSIIQTKKEKYAKSGLNARQLYLMTRWPKFYYKGYSWEFDVIPDVFSFYLFVIDPSSSQTNKSSFLSSSFLTRLLRMDEFKLLDLIDQKISILDPNFMYREKVNSSTLPFSFTSFLIRMLNLSIGSQSLEVRRFLKQYFFPLMEDIEDCHVELRTKDIQKPSYKSPDSFDFNDYDDSLSGNNDDILAIRIKLFLKRLET